MRGIPSAPDRLKANVEGDIHNMDGVMKITQIRVSYELHYEEGQLDKVQRAFDSHKEKCPAYMSLKDAMDFQVTLRKM